MGSTLTTLEYLAKEIAADKKGPWLEPKALVENGMFCVDMVALWNCCSRCFKTRLRTMGEGVHCECGQRTVNQYRRVRVQCSERAVVSREGAHFRRIAQALSGIASAHPAEFREELTVVDVGLWEDPPPKLEAP
jgi:hypothetical protein